MGCCTSSSESVIEHAGELKGKVAIVTGANTGIGEYTAYALSLKGAKVIVAGRSKVRIEEAIKRIHVKHAQADLISMQLDLGSFASVRQFVDEFLKLNLPLHLLINNAGMWAGDYETTGDGFEATLQTNHLSPFMLTYLLLDKLKASAPSRIVNVASALHTSGKFDIAHINPTKEEFSAGAAYNNSKLHNVLHALYLADLLQASNVSVFSLHPGVIATGIGRNSCMLNCFYKSFGCCLKNISQGAATTVYCATAPGIEKLSGSYFADCRKTTPSRDGQSKQNAKLLWDKSLELCRLDGGVHRDEEKKA